MTCHAGKTRVGRGVNLNDLKLSEKITQAVETRQFVLFPRVSAPTEKNRVRSALIGPIVDPVGCFGVLYIDNSMDHEHYSMSDLDYLMLLAIHTATIIEHF